jgi:hypothetical protein
MTAREALTEALCEAWLLADGHGASAVATTHMQVDAVIAAVRALPVCGECDGSGYQSVAHTLEGDADLAEAPVCDECQGLGRA